MSEFVSHTKAYRGGWICVVCKFGSLVRSNFKFTPNGICYCNHCWEKRDA
jgi:hypothetical protein